MDKAIDVYCYCQLGGQITVKYTLEPHSTVKH